MIVKKLTLYKAYDNLTHRVLLDMIRLNDAHKQFVEYLESLGRSSSTLTAYNKDIEQLMDHLEKDGVTLVSEATLAQIQEFMNKLGNQGFTNKTISRKTNATKTFFKFLKDKGHIIQDVAEFLKHPKVEIKQPRILSKVEYRALRDAARDDVRSYAMIEVLIQTGVTISELAGMKIEHLSNDTEKGKLFVPDFNNKLHRTIPLNKAVIEAVTNYLEKERPKQASAMHLFITKTGRPMLVRNIRSTINRYFKLAGAENAKVNDIRHTFVAHHLAQGVSIVHLSKIAGHKRLSTTERYLQYIEKETDSVKTELGIL